MRVGKLIEYQKRHGIILRDLGNNIFKVFIYDNVPEKIKYLTLNELIFIDKSGKRSHNFLKV